MWNIIKLNSWMFSNKIELNFLIFYTAHIAYLVHQWTPVFVSEQSFCQHLLAHQILIFLSLFGHFKTRFIGFLFHRYCHSRSWILLRWLKSWSSKIFCGFRWSVLVYQGRIRWETKMIKLWKQNLKAFTTFCSSWVPFRFFHLARFRF